MKHYMLPTGNCTKNEKYYLRSWISIGRKVEKKTGWTLTSFDPTFKFVKDDNLTITLPLWAIKDLFK